MFRGVSQVYPRANGEVYLCGLGGSEHVSPEQLRAGECVARFLLRERSEACSSKHV